jgi:hypothetical protein
VLDHELADIVGPGAAIGWSRGTSCQAMSGIVSFRSSHLAASYPARKAEEMNRSRERIWIMVDVETTGPVIGEHSLTEIGAVVGGRRTGAVDRFEALIAPRVPSNHGPLSAMRAFAAWSKPWQERGAEFIARPAAFDWPWIVQYAWRHLGANPFGFRAVCASSWFLALGKRFHVDLPHRGVEDAEIQLVHFLEEGGASV